jgi:hypothetical protein
MDNHANRIAKLSPEKRALLELTLKRKELEIPAQQIIAPIANRAPAPLSFAQQRLWFLSKLEPDSSAYNEPTAIRLTGELNFQTLNKALAAVVERHKVLRTTLLSPDGESPVQLVGEPRAVDLSTVDLTECSNVPTSLHWLRHTDLRQRS